MRQNNTIADYVRSPSHAAARVLATLPYCALEGFEQVECFSNQGSRAWEDTFVMPDEEEDLPTVRADLYA